MNFKKIFIILLVILASLAGVWIVKSFKGPDGSHVASHGDIYYCPMHPQIQSDHPGICPICSMKLVKKEKAQTLPAADATPKKAQEICLIHNCHKLHEGGGSCPMMVVAKEGEIIKCPICGTFIGQESGHLLPLDSKKSAVKGYATIKLNLQKQQLIGVKTAKAQKKKLNKIIHTVGTIEHEPGWVYVPIYQSDRPLIKRGQDVEIRVPGFEDERFKGKIRSIETFADPATHTRTMKARVEDPRGFLRLGMYVDVLIPIDLGEALSVPAQAVFSTGTRHIVFVDKGDGHFEPRDVAIGIKTENEYEIKDGIKEGELVVVSGNFLIDSESRLQSAFEWMSSTENSAASKPAEGSEPQHAH